jgi:hypothetical protein
MESRRSWMVFNVREIQGKPRAAARVSNLANPGISLMWLIRE